ncbi:hypothetical protein C3Y90_24020 [Rhizobium sp. UPM1134]|nr:hypothetical protein [Rhizobium ruizarguesonis]
MVLIPELGALSMGSVMAVILADRFMREWPPSGRARWLFAIWTFALTGGVAVEAVMFLGLGSLPWLSAGAATGGLARMAMSSAGNDQS